MSSEISTWQKAKDAALVAFVALASLAMMQLLHDVAELKRDIAVYQADQRALKEDHERLRAEVAEHFRADRNRFADLEFRRR